MKRVLVIQTASIGDVVLATSLLESLHSYDATLQIDLLTRSDHKSLFLGHPYLNRLLLWDKKSQKYKKLLQLLFQIQAKNYDAVFCIQRFFSTGLLTAFSGAKHRIGFKKNPLSLFFTKRVAHKIEAGIHEIDRNHALLTSLFKGVSCAKPKLYPSQHDFAKVSHYKSTQYITISPASLWPTKQFPKHKFIELCNALGEQRVYLLGGKSEKELCNAIARETENKEVIVLAGRLSLLQSAALMEHAQMNITNDSAPLHLASARNAPITAIFCSTVSEFGFGPLSDHSYVVETKESLLCRPCNLHGKKTCPKGHFKCAENISIEEILSNLTL